MPIPTRSSSPPWFYRLLIRLVSPIFLAYTVFRSVKDGGWKYFTERFGFYGSSKTINGENAQLWIHAASVGEVITVLPLVKAWLEENDRSVLFTTGTPTGAAVLNKQNISRIEQQYLPLDFPGACRRFFKQANVAQGWIVETEIWPWLYATANSHGIDLSIINGRLSDKTSKQSNSVLGKSYSQALTNVQVLARSEADQKKFIALGAKANNVIAAGDLKYAASETSLAEEPIIYRPFVLAASTHADEEIRIAKVWMNARQDDTLLVIAPRHPERSSEIYKELCKLGYSVLRRTSTDILENTHDIYLADTLGELDLFYQFATGAFVGGSLIERGGHNIMEPARFACPTVVGPHTFNFDDMVSRMVKDEALTIAHDENSVAAFFVNVCAGDTDILAKARKAKDIAVSDKNDVMKNYLQLLS